MEGVGAMMAMCNSDAMAAAARTALAMTMAAAATIAAAMKIAVAEKMTMMTECGRINSQRRLATTMEGVGAMMAVCSSEDGRAAVMTQGGGSIDQGKKNVQRGARWQGMVPSNQKMVTSTKKDGHARPPYRTL